MSFNEHIGKFLSPISRFFGSQPGPVESPEVPDASLKRKRSEECQPRTNSADNPICIEDEADAEEDEIIADSEEERDEMRLRGACKLVALPLVSCVNFRVKMASIPVHIHGTRDKGPGA